MGYTDLVIRSHDAVVAQQLERSHFNFPLSLLSVYVSDLQPGPECTYASRTCSLSNIVTIYSHMGQLAHLTLGIISCRGLRHEPLLASGTWSKTRYGS